MVAADQADAALAKSGTRPFDLTRADEGRPLVNLDGHAELPGSHLVAPAGRMGCRLTEVVKGRLLGRSGRLGRWWPGHSAADLSRPASPSPPAGAPTASGPTVRGRRPMRSVMELPPIRLEMAFRSWDGTNLTPN
jgi:hypothetical protein